MDLDPLLELNDVACVGQTDVYESDDGPGRGGLLQLKENLQEQEEAFEGNEVLCLVALLKELDQVAKGLAILLHLVAHGGNVVQENGIDLVCAAKGGYWWL